MPLRILGFSIIILTLMFYFLGGKDVEENYIRNSMYIVFYVGISFVLMKYGTHVKPKKEEVVWQAGFVFLWYNYRKVGFDNVNSIFVRYRKEDQYVSTEGRIVKIKPAWELVLRLKNANGQKKGGDEYVLTTFREKKKEKANRYSKELTEILSQ